MTYDQIREQVKHVLTEHGFDVDDPTRMQRAMAFLLWAQDIFEVGIARVFYWALGGVIAALAFLLNIWVYSLLQAMP